MLQEKQEHISGVSFVEVGAPKVGDATPAAPATPPSPVSGSGPRLFDSGVPHRSPDTSPVASPEKTAHIPFSNYL